MTLAAVPPMRETSAQSGVREGSLGKITTRPSVAEDSAFMLELYASTSQDVLDDLGWTIGSQRTFVIMQAQTEEWNRARLYPGMDRLTICVDDLAVGRLLVCMRNNILHLVDLSLLPRYRGNGIGTQLMTEILEEARNARVPVKVKVRKDSGAIRFVERLGFGTPTDLGANVELTWMPPLSALGPDAREGGFTSGGSRAHRPAPLDEDELSEDALQQSGLDAYDPADLDPVTRASREAQEIAAEMQSSLATLEAETEALEAEADTEVADPTDADATEADVTDEEAVDAGEAEVNDATLAVQQYLADNDSEYAVEPAWLAPEVVQEEVVEEEEEIVEEVVEEDPEIAARKAEIEESVAATDEFTAGFTSTFSGEIAEETVDDEDEALPFGADRYDPFA
jgi:GNAT superfamily N-acetyltransferase